MIMCVKMEKQKEYLRKWRLENPDKVKEFNRKYNLENKEKRKEFSRKWRLENPEKYDRSRRIYKWKYQGIIFHDYDLLHDIYIQTTHCDLCNIFLTNDNSSAQKCLDHDHSITDDNNVRNVLCRSCNNKVG